MPCNNIKYAWQSTVQNKNGKYPLLFQYGKNCGTQLEIPCGKCIACKLEHSRQWALRCEHEISLHSENTYITLTYDQEHIPSTGSLVKKDFQDFMKRYRKSISPKKIRYFMCGEYGDELSRPHYHAIIFGHEFPDAYHFKTKKDIKYYRSPQLEKLWTNGQSIIGQACFETAAYVARYITKKITGDTAFDHYSTIDTATGELGILLPEYISMSTGNRHDGDGGIGRNWYKRFKRDLDKDFITSRGIRMRAPKYYDRLQQKDEPELHTIKKDKRRESAAKSDWREKTPERLAVKEHILKKKLKLLERGYENERANIE
jgi:hypothetical protein